MEGDIVSHTKSHFDHANEITELLNILLTGTDADKGAKIIKRLSEILDMYQEQSHLMDPYLENLVGPVIVKLREYVERPQDFSPNSTGHLLFRYLYLVTKTRGYKTVVKFMSHDVADLEPVFEFLCVMDDRSVPWETRYICFIWLSLICMIPFDLKRVDSASNTEASLISRMFNVCKEFLKSTGKERDGAGLLLARLLSRRDIGDALMPYIDWTKMRLNSDADVFEITGILSSLCSIYIYASREVLLPTLDNGVIPLLTMDFFDKYENNSLVRKLRTKLTQRVGLCYLKPKIAPWRYQRGHRSMRQNLGDGSSTATAKAGDLIDLESGSQGNTDDDEYVSDNLETVIDILLNGLRDKDTIVRWSAAKGIGRITQRLPHELAEDVIDYLLELFQENTLISPSTLKLDLSAVSDSTWHGASLAVAELARRGLLLPHRLKETIPWIMLALKFDLKRGSHSIGAHVRDAACYVCWSFARAYAPSVMEPFVGHIAKNLVVVSVFDREINVRRASSAAFQENVGRQGIFPCGIDIIQLADYFSLGNRSNAFLSVAFEIAKYKDYTDTLVNHLVSTTTRHWDKAMRVLAASALQRLATLQPYYFINLILPDLAPYAVHKDMQISHGALLATAEICLALKQCRDNDTELEAYWQSKQQLIKELGSIPSRIPPKSLTTFGSEHIREAVCRLVESMAIVHIPNFPIVVEKQVMTTALDTWKNMVHSSLERKEENVQEFAVAAFGAIAATYGISKEETYTCLDKIASARLVYGRRGYALALGKVSYLVDDRRAWLPDVLRHLCSAAQVQQEQQANDAEAKRNAVIGLRNIIVNVDGEFKQVLSKDDFEALLNSLQLCLADYSTDQRGDVGSWVRSASMECLQCLLPLIARIDATSPPETCFLTTTGITRVIAALLKQSVERIDRVRDCAGTVLCDLLYTKSTKNPVLLDIPNREMLEKYITSDISWSSPADLYPVMTHILSAEPYRFELLTGLISSAGGLTESLVRHSSSCLIDYMNSLPTTSSYGSVSLENMARNLLQIFTNYEKQDRVILPLMDVVGLLYESGTLGKIEKDVIHNNFLIAVRKECFKSKNIRKLLSATKVYAGMTSLQCSQVKVKAIQQMLSYLIHAFPRVRMEVSDQLYTYISVLDDEEMTEGTMKAEEIITGTDWSGALPEIKATRDKLYGLLKVPKPVLKATKK
ncbi:tubulin folding cofactor D C terminal-domain-containing protein [Zychaea mexicana]|uniref:tubulin folding cofactor D C terminal-domain-containing protein n=1 Tax=Zychaea mexicana TaxID=64656 RepID=UPI0022FED771|nr:tubulin folding cofactor D C terminal-domain-containing protein [Zychaea mexicana]KAI9499220.1 tubulin folding cofactor D C terminal-domain-containing protein [Zychaea mexicana]